MSVYAAAHSERSSSGCASVTANIISRLVVAGTALLVVCFWVFGGNPDERTDAQLAVPHFRRFLLINLDEHNSKLEQRARRLLYFVVRQPAPITQPGIGSPPWKTRGTSPHLFAFAKKRPTNGGHGIPHSRHKRRGLAKKCCTTAPIHG